MRTVLHIFRKDAVRLWKEIAVTWALLGWLTQMDCWRSGYLPGSQEGWLNLLLPLAWSYLAAVCVLQDAVPGERQFWLALPAGRGTMLGAKALFAAVFIHAPYLISCMAVLAARGFNPLGHVPVLAEKQVVLLAVVTLPALALASLARNAMQFMLAAIALAGGAAMLNGNGLARLPNQGPPLNDLRWTFSAVALALFAAAILRIQYRERRTTCSRGIGLTGIALAGALYLWLPQRSSASLEAVMHPMREDPITVRALVPDTIAHAEFPPRAGVSVSIPVDIAALAPQSAMTYSQLDFEIDGPGIRLRADPGGVGMGKTPSLFAVIGRSEEGSSHLNVMMERGVYASASRGPVILKGHFQVSEMAGWVRHALSEPGRTAVADLGQCGASVTAERLYREGGLRVVCESPETLPRTRVTLTDSVTGRHWEGLMGGSRSFVTYPTLTWLSPVNRSEAYFQLSSRTPNGPGEQWLIPQSTLEHFRLEAETQRVVGTRVVGYELKGIDLSRYVARDRR